jgi:thiosulfate dehydrogenase [quinone] large subunit
MVNIAKDHDTAVRATTRPTAGPLPLKPDIAGYEATVAGSTTPVNHAMPDRSEPVPVATTGSDTRSAMGARYLLAGIRLALGSVFLWAFLDKAFGLGHDTTSARSWLNGGSPTKGFLGSAAKGPFTSFYHSIAGTGVVDVLFMVALFAVGSALILGIGMRLAAVAGALLTVMMWTAVLPPASNPFMDDHLIYAAVLIVLALLGAGNTLGLGRAWAVTPLVQRAPWLT